MSGTVEIKQQASTEVLGMRSEFQILQMRYGLLRMRNYCGGNSRHSDIIVHLAILHPCVHIAHSIIGYGPAHGGNITSQAGNREVLSQPQPLRSLNCMKSRTWGRAKAPLPQVPLVCDFVSKGDRTDGIFQHTVANHEAGNQVLQCQHVGSYCRCRILVGDSSGSQRLGVLQMSSLSTSSSRQILNAVQNSR